MLQVCLACSLRFLTHLRGFVVGRVPRHYDLLWPVARRIKSPAEANAKAVEDTVRLKQKLPLSHAGTFIPPDVTVG